MLLNGGTTLAKPPLPSRNVHVNQQQLHAQKKNQIAGPSSTSALSSRQVNALKFTGGVSTNPKAGGEKQEKDKSDRATQEQVLDNRTRLVLKSLGGRGVITKIENCISTGKEVRDDSVTGHKIILTVPTFRPTCTIPRQEVTKILRTKGP